jgi:hypothetical protein
MVKSGIDLFVFLLKAPATAPFDDSADAKCQHELENAVVAVATNSRPFQ